MVAIAIEVFSMKSSSNALVVFVSKAIVTVVEHVHYLLIAFPRHRCVFWPDSDFPLHHHHTKMDQHSQHHSEKVMMSRRYLTNYF